MEDPVHVVERASRRLIPHRGADRLAAPSELGGVPHPGPVQQRRGTLRADQQFLQHQVHGGELDDPPDPERVIAADRV